jgi:transketolase
MEIVLPRTASEYDRLFRAAYANGHPTYFRLSGQSNPQSFDVEFGRANVSKKGRRHSRYCWHITRANARCHTIALIEPYYEGTLAQDIVAALAPTAVQIATIGASSFSHELRPSRRARRSHWPDICGH